MASRALLVAFAFGTLSCVPVGVSREQAIQLALREGTRLEQPVAVMGAREGRLGELRNNPDSQIGSSDDQRRLVWEVTLQGWVSICRPTGQGCVVALGTSRVYVDQASGAIVASETSANPGPFPP